MYGEGFLPGSPEMLTSRAQLFPAVTVRPQDEAEGLRQWRWCLSRVITR